MSRLAKAGFSRCDLRGFVPGAMTTIGDGGGGGFVSRNVHDAALYGDDDGLRAILHCEFL